MACWCCIHRHRHRFVNEAKFSVKLRLKLAACLLIMVLPSKIDALLNLRSKASILVCSILVSFAFTFDCRYQIT